MTTPQRIVFVDTETTDIEPNRAVPWEIGTPDLFSFDAEASA